MCGGQERALVSQAAQQRYGVELRPSNDPLIPFVPVPKPVPLDEEMERQLRTFRATSGSG